MSASSINPSSSPPPAAASGDSSIDFSQIATYAGIFALAAVGVNYVARSMSGWQVTVNPTLNPDSEILVSQALQYLEPKEHGQPPTEEDYETAIRILTSALEKTSSPRELHAKILVQRGHASMMINAYKDAIADFSCFLELYREDECRPGVLINRAHCYEHLQKFGEALKDLSVAESSTSDKQLKLTIFFNRGCLYQDRCDCENAIKEFKQALKCNPTNAMKVEVLHRLGFCSSEEDLYDDAIQYLTSALEVPDIEQPTVAEILYHRATVYTKIDESDKALKDLSYALKNQPSEDTRKDILQLIQEVRDSNPKKLG